MAISSAWPCKSCPRYLGVLRGYHQSTTPEGRSGLRPFRQHTHSQNGPPIRLDIGYSLRAFRRISLFVSIQSRTSFKTASLLVRDAIRDLLNILFIIWSNVEICGLAVRWVLTLEDGAGDVVVNIWVELAARVLLGELDRWPAGRDVVGGVVWVEV